MPRTAKPYRTACLVGVLFCAGCASFQSERDAIARYEQTREEMNRVARGDWQQPSYEEESELVQREAKKPLEAGDFAPKKIGATIRRIIGRGPSQPEAERLFAAGNSEYSTALALSDQRQLDEARPRFIAAAEYFSEAAERWPESTLEQNALYFAGEAYFFADRYPKSNDCFELLLKNHPNSKYLDQVQQRRFAIAQYWLEEYNKSRPGWYVVNVTDTSRPRNDLFGRSMRVFDRIRLDDPTGKLADDATLALANAYFAEGKFFKADEYYTDLRKTFPSSEHQFTAHFVGLKAKLMVYEGPEYGGTVLNDAEKLIETLRRQFPVEAEQQRDYLNRAYAETRYKKAEREFLTAQYFDQKAEYGSAKQYFAVVLNDYGDTPFADRARTRVAELGGLPDVPPQRFEWLVDAFPREGNARPLIATDKPKAKKR